MEHVVLLSLHKGRFETEYGKPVVLLNHKACGTSLSCMPCGTVLCATGHGCYPVKWVCPPHSHPPTASLEVCLVFPAGRPVAPWPPRSPDSGSYACRGKVPISAQVAAHLSPPPSLHLSPVQGAQVTANEPDKPCCGRGKSWPAPVLPILPAADRLAALRVRGGSCHLWAGGSPPPRGGEKKLEKKAREECQRYAPAHLVTCPPSPVLASSHCDLIVIC